MISTKNNSDRLTDGPWYDTFICTGLHGTVFEINIINAKTDRYNIMCFIGSHEKNSHNIFYYGSSGGGKAIPSN